MQAQTGPVSVAGWQDSGGTLRWPVWQWQRMVQKAHIAGACWGHLYSDLRLELFDSSIEFGSRAEQFRSVHGTGKENMVGN